MQLLHVASLWYGPSPEARQSKDPLADRKAREVRDRDLSADDQEACTSPLHAPSTNPTKSRLFPFWAEITPVGL